MADVDIPLGPLTVLVGRNGSGKSTFVDIFRFLRDSLNLGLDAAVTRRHGFPSLRRWSASRPHNVALGLSLDRSTHSPVSGTYFFELASGQGGSYYVKTEYWRPSVDNGPEGFSVKNGSITKLPASLRRQGRQASLPQAPLSPTVLALQSSIGYFTIPLFQLRRYIENIAAYSIVPNMLRQPQDPSNSDRLDENGSNLASVLKQLEQDNNPRLTEIKTALAYVVPEIRDLSVRQSGGYLSIQFAHKSGSERSHWFNASQESDGTLRVLGLLTAMHSDQSPTLLALEEPELFIHPGAIPILCDIIRDSSARSQVVLTTHSPELLSRFRADEIRVVERTEGRTYIGLISERQRSIIENQLFTPGDLLLAEGLDRKT
jgi:predicted ATPase